MPIAIRELRPIGRREGIKPLKNHCTTDDVVLTDLSAEDAETLGDDVALKGGEGSVVKMSLVGYQSQGLAFVRWGQGNLDHDLCERMERG